MTANSCPVGFAIRRRNGVLGFVIRQSYVDALFMIFTIHK